MSESTFSRRQWERSLLRRLFHWLFSWRGVRAALLGFVGLVTLIALIYVFENWRGWRALERERRALAAQGEKWDWRDFVPRPVPDDQNFALTPLFKPVLDYERSTNGGGIRWRDTNGLAKLQRVRLDHRAIYQAADSSKPLPAFTMFQLANLGPVDLAAWQDYYRGNTNFPQAATGSAAGDVLVALSAFDPELGELTTNTAQRPFCRFPVRYEEENKWGMLLPHLANLKGLSYVVALRAAARIQTGQSAQSLADVKLGLRLAETPSEEPFLISYLVRLAVHDISLKAVHVGLAQHTWSEPQLAELQRTLQSIDLLAGYQHAMQGDRAWSAAGLEYFGNVRNPEELKTILHDFGPGEMIDQRAFGWMFAAIPVGWFRQQEVAVSQFHQQYTLAMVDGKARRVNPDLMSAATNQIMKLWRVPFPLPMLQFLHEIPLTAGKMARTQTWIDQAVIGCALERHRLAEGKFPETLAALVPRFLPSVPHDLFTGEALLYRLLPEGGYLLYSVGWNKLDDGGTTARRPHVEVTTDEPESGDWVWTVPK